MFNGYKITEFKTNYDDNIFRLSSNGSYYESNTKTRYSLEGMLFNNPSVSDDKIIITKVEKDNGEILEIGSKIKFPINNKEHTLIGFVLDKTQNKIYIKIDSDQYTRNILTCILIKEEPQAELDFYPEVEHVSGYSLDDIKQVLSEALDKPEVDQLLIDFKNFKRSNDTNTPKEEIKVIEEFKLPEKFYFKTPKFGLDEESRNLLKKWCNNTELWEFSAYDNRYCFNNRKTISNMLFMRSTNDIINYVPLDLDVVLNYLKKESEKTNLDKPGINGYSFEVELNKDMWESYNDELKEEYYREQEEEHQRHQIEEQNPNKFDPSF